ncbi:MAG TPA: nucleoside hydrolase [Firmicutes bacterium]|nr:nucleoside hydrolase [Bacillota bacterium]
MKWIIDTDPGIDDASAIITAVNSGALDILGITSVHGNVGLNHTTRNALKLVELMGGDVPVYQGTSRPILQQREHAAEYHGENGFGNTSLPEPGIAPQDQYAVDFIIESTKKQEVSLLTLGPLTNVALAIAKERELEKRIKQIVMMAGTSRARGNTSPLAEFNIFADPEAAAVVFESGIPIIMVPWETCLDTVFGSEVIVRIRRSSTEVGKAFAQAMEYSVGRTKAYLGSEVLLLCDLLAACAAIDPTVITQQLNAKVTVETGGRFSRGLTVIDERMDDGSKPNASIALACDRAKIENMFLDAINAK